MRTTFTKNSPSAKLASLLQQRVGVTENDKQLIDESFESVQVQKNEILVQHGSRADYLYFINSGFIRVFHFEQGEEITNHIAYENFFVTAYNSFTTRTSSQEVVQALSICDLLRISKDKLDRLYKLSHNMALFGLSMADHYLVFNNQRAKDLITLNAEEKYKKLLRDEPQILQNVPLQYISSYIGIEPQTLSKIRRKIIS